MELIKVNGKSILFVVFVFCVSSSHLDQQVLLFPYEIFVFLSKDK
jgi:hypothetical protein